MTDTLTERILAATNGSQLGAILRCAFNKNGQTKRMLFVGQASVTSDGFVTCSFIDAWGNSHLGAFVGAISDLDANLAGLAKHLKLTAGEIEEMNAAVAGWIATDYRLNKWNPARPFNALTNPIGHTAGA